MIAFAVAALCAGCSSTFAVREVSSSSITADNVLKLTDYPANRSYRQLVTIEIEAYRAGLSQPTADDVWGEVSKAVTAKGGNACLLRGQKPDDLWARRVWVTCEVLSVSEIRS